MSDYKCEICAKPVVPGNMLCRKCVNDSRSNAVILGNDPNKCNHIYPVTRDGRCHGCGSIQKNRG